MMNIQLKMKKTHLIKGKITKSPKKVTNTTSLLDIEFIRYILHGLFSIILILSSVSCILYSFVKRHLNNQKGCLFNEKIAKSSVTFRKNKPNFINSEIGVNPFKTSKYEISPACRGEKTNPIKANLSQYKANSNPICYNAIIGLSSFMASEYVDLCRWRGKKTNPNKPNNLVGGSDHTNAAIDFPPIKATICKCLNLFNNSHQKTKIMKPRSENSMLKSLFLASRPNFLAASAAPVLVGSTLGYAISGSFNFGLFILALLAIMALQAGANMANDYFDHVSGNDWANNNVTPFSGGSRYIQQGIITPRTELLAALIALAAGSVIGLIIVMLTKSLLILVLGIIGLLGGFFYTAPPIKLGYRCVGELVIALLFGLLPVFGSYYLQTGKIDIIPLLPAGIVAILIFLIILINEFPDLAADASVNKKTIIVRLGVPASVWIYRIAVISGFVFAAAMLIYRSMFFAGLLYLFTLPVAALAVKSANKKDLAKPGQFRANQLTVILHTSGSLALTIGFIIMGLRNTAI